MNLFQTLLSHRKHARVLAAGCVALAAGGIVLLRAPHSTSAAPHTGGDTHATQASPSGAPRVEFSGPWAHGRVALSQGRVLAGGQRQVFAEVRLAADNRQLPENSARPVAMALVLDVSGSMEGEKLVQARNAVLEMVDRMRDTDQISLVTYSDNARVVQPLARVRDVRAQLHLTVPTINSEGGTNIPSGLMAGAQTLSDAPEGVVRRVVLMSDGRDGSGQSLDTIAAGLRVRADRGVTLSSLGVGADYDETFMSRLADAGRGNYEFMRDGAQLRAFLGRELQQATRTTVERAVAEVTLPSGWHLTRAYGAEAQVTGKTSVGGGLFNFTFGATSNFATSVGLNASYDGKAMVALWADDTPDWQFAGATCTTTGPGGDCEANAKNGELFMVTGITSAVGNQNAGFWYANGAPDLVSFFTALGTEVAAGQFNYGLNVLYDATGKLIYGGIGCSPLNALAGFCALGQVTDVGGSGQLLGSQGTGTPYLATDDTDFRAKYVPEPGVLALMGAGLFGLGAFRRSRSRA